MTDLSTLDLTPAEQRWPLLRRAAQLAAGGPSEGRGDPAPGCCG